SSYRSALFNDESNYIFSNSTFKDININSRSLITVMYNSLTFNNCNFRNIICYGSGDATSLIEFISKKDGNSISLINTIIENSKSNGDLIKISGDNTIMNLSNIIFNNIISYGSLLNDVSLNSTINISDSEIINNQNINKFKCGLIVNSLSTELNISTSSFSNNKSKSNGGML
ncbi:hypothetical protein BCR36DRAFT_294812, partial [Piromyces finnis]